jgi:uncharacterized protein (DUF1501 family)
MLHDTLTRRDFLRAGAAALGLGLTDVRAAAPPRARACIQLMLVGGPGHLDTFDPKPDAPAEVRGPFRPIPTRVPGVLLSELLPQTARRADRIAIVRSVHHGETPIHETGLQLLQTGRLAHPGLEWPHVGAVVDALQPPDGAPAWVVLPGPIRDTGVCVSHGQSVGFLGGAEPPSLAERHRTRALGHCCLLARRLVERGARVVTVNMFDTVFGKVTWDCHAAGGDLRTTLEDYRVLGPVFDQAYSALLDDLAARGLLDTTLVVCAGEFGRTPRVNRTGGRDHWARVWSVLLAGGGVQGGRVVGASDRHGAEPADRPVHAAEIAATVYHALGIDPRTPLRTPDGRSLPLVPAAPVWELF